MIRGIKSMGVSKRSEFCRLLVDEADENFWKSLESREDVGTDD